MRRNSVLTYLHADHPSASLRTSLGSPVLTTASGITNATQNYRAYGKVRSFAGSFPTRYQCTGQYKDDSGLQYFNARYYDPQLGTFISPDTLVPDPTNVFDYNRYMYALGNPMKYNDTSGHNPACMSMAPVAPLVMGCEAGMWLVENGPTAVQLAAQWADKVPAMWDWMFNSSNATNTANTVSQSGNSSTGNPNDWDPSKYQGVFKSTAERYQYQTSQTLLNQQTRLNITMNGKAGTVDVDGIVNNFIHESKFLDPATNFYSKQIGKGGPSGLELHVKGWGDLFQRQSVAAQQFGYQGVKVFTNSKEAVEMAKKLFGDKDWFKMIDIIYEAAK